ncbi:hypothetical protein [Paraburkholderia flagellata]|uniref:hypothetical protein n=1 Tax=Paraburkholderia flagellata TaxID=2883241 RepID=UPI001F2B934B|nr:hypothetical protein [Paraburkholderia flagellata]
MSNEAKSNGGRPRNVPAAPATVPPMHDLDGTSKKLNCSKGTVRNLWYGDPDFPEPTFVGDRPFWFENELAAYLEVVRTRRSSKRKPATFDAE